MTVQLRNGISGVIIDHIGWLELADQSVAYHWCRSLQGVESLDKKRITYENVPYHEFRPVSIDGVIKLAVDTPTPNPEVIPFLLGEASYLGINFGQTIPEKGVFWWRTALRQHIHYLESKISDLQSKPEPMVRLKPGALDNRVTELAAIRIKVNEIASQKLHYSHEYKKALDQIRKLTS